LVRKFDLISKVENFQGGQISKKYNFWKKLTSDQNILSIIKGDSIEFLSKFPICHFAKTRLFTTEEDKYIEKEISKLLK